MISRSQVLLLATAACALLLAPATSSAAVNIGQVSPSPNQSCAVENSPSVQSTTAPGTASYAVPAPGGVITSWSNAARSGNGQQLKFKVFRPAPAPTFLAVGESALQDIKPTQTNTFPARIPVAGGDLIGLVTGPNSAGGPPDCFFNTGNGGDALYERGANEDFAVNTTAPFNGPFDNLRVNVAATVEPDADGDGFGDETQDACPSNKAAQGACPAAGPGGGAPSNQFSFGKVKSSSNGTASLTANVPGPGKLVASDAGASASTSARRKALIKRASKTATAAGAVRLKLRPSSAGAKRLRRNGSLSAKVKVTFTPNGGKAASKTKRVKLRLR